MSLNGSSPCGSGWQNRVRTEKEYCCPRVQVRLPAAGHFFEATTLYFGQNPASSYVAASREEAELLFAVAHAGLVGEVTIPSSEKECARVAVELKTHLADAHEKFEALASERAGTDRLRDQLVKLLLSWLIRGQQTAAAAARAQD